MQTLTFDIPDELFSALRRTPRELARDLRLAAAIHWYRRAELSQDKATALAGLDRTDLLLELSRQGVDAFVVDFEDLDIEPGRG